jgi:hypothetical protein
MYLTEGQVKAILKIPYWSQSVTESIDQYTLYRGQYKTKVLTLRFNKISSYSDDFLTNYVLSEVPTYFKMGENLLCSFQYDFLLVDPKSDPKSYYIWRANSNRVHFESDNETRFELSEANLKLFCNNATNINYDSLNLPFNSAIIIDTVLGIVLTFLNSV